MCHRGERIVRRVSTRRRLTANCAADGEDVLIGAWLRVCLLQPAAPLSCSGSGNKPSRHSSAPVAAAETAPTLTDGGGVAGGGANISHCSWGSGGGGVLLRRGEG